MLVSTYLAHYYTLTCQLTKLHVIAPLLESALENETLPVIPRIINAYLLVIQRLYLAEADKALEFSQKGFELSKKSGIHSFEDMLLANNIACYICNNDLVSARNTLQQAIRISNPKRRFTIAMLHSSTAWLAAQDGNLYHALEQSQIALQLTRLINLEIGYVCSLSLKVQILAELSQWQEAELALSLLYTKVKDSHNQFNMMHYYVAEAWLAYLQQNETRAIIVLKQLFQILSSEQIFTFFNWRPKVLTPLCLLAIENDIEQEFAVQLLKKHQLLASPPLHLEKWPWPVRIYSFGSLAIVLNGKPIEQSGKSQKKILELLETLILLGGRNVNGIFAHKLL